LVGASRFAGQVWSIFAAAAIILGSVALLLRPRWLALLVKAIYGRLRRAPRLFAGILRLLRTLQTLVAPQVLVQALTLGLLGWSAEVVGAWLVLHGLGAEVDFAATAFVFAFGMLVGAVPLFPGGVGGAEGAMVALLVLLGINLATALTATGLIRLATLGFAVVLGFFVLPAALRQSGMARPATPQP
jgi:uncharacterized protein (TIRG00374 family)